LYGKELFSGLREPDITGSRRQKVVVEFSSPNIGKEFDGNHLRSTIIGAYIASLHESMDWDVVKMNFLGDWGKHIGLLAVGWSRFGSEELLEKNHLMHLVDVYNKIEEIFKSEQDAVKKHRNQSQGSSAIETQGIDAEKDEFFKKMEDGDPGALTLWRRFRDICVANYNDLYARLNISFNEYSGESEVSQETVAEVESILKEKGFYDESEEACVINFKKHGYKGLGTAIARYRNGTTSYLLRDVAAALERSRKYSFDKMIYVVSAKQDSHFQQLFTTLKMMGYSDIANQLQHVSFGKAQGALPKSGSGILLGDMLEQCQTTIHTLLEVDPEYTKEFQGGDSKVLEVLSATALMVQDLSIKRGSSFTFDIEKIAIIDGHTGLNLQHWFAKLCSKLSGASIPRDELENADYTMFEQEEYADVLRILIQFPHAVKSSFKLLESSAILGYLFRLTDLLPFIWNEEEGEGSDQNPAELAFYESVRKVLENGMALVGLVPIRV
jgi:arginyl-tRNA synthetase